MLDLIRIRLDAELARATAAFQHNKNKRGRIGRSDKQVPLGEWTHLDREKRRIKLEMNQLSDALEEHFRRPPLRTHREILEAEKTRIVCEMTRCTAEQNRISSEWGKLNVALMRNTTALREEECRHPTMTRAGLVANLARVSIALRGIDVEDDRYIPISDEWHRTDAAIKKYDRVHPYQPPNV